jgi:RND family efflux transporter MFP subunit
MQALRSKDYNDMDVAESKRGGKARIGLWIWRVLIFILPVIVILAAVAATMAMGSLKPEPEEKEEQLKAIPVLTARADRQDVTLHVRTQGDVQPRTEIGIVPQVNGRISYMSPKFIDGGRFAKGDLLVRIDPREFELRVIQARAELAQAETGLEREKSESLIARRDWEDIGRQDAPSALTLRKPQMAEARANLEASKARLAEAQLQLSRTALYAPFTGRVTRRLIDGGEFITAGTRLGEVYAADIMDVRLPLTHEQLRRTGLKMGYEAPKSGGVKVMLSADVGGQYSQWPAQIIRTDSRFDGENRVLFVYAEVKDPFKAETPLAPGLFVDAKIDGQTLKDMIIVPRAALRGADKIYLANADETLTIQTVDVISTDREQAVISGGLSADDLVITSPIRGVANGMKIDLVDRIAPRSTGGQP